MLAAVNKEAWDSTRYVRWAFLRGHYYVWDKFRQVTPGDAYLWRLNEQGLPVIWQMWVSILPIGGLQSSWEGWTALKTGARLATRHEASLYTLELCEAKGGNSPEPVDLDKDPFRELD